MGISISFISLKISHNLFISFAIFTILLIFSILEISSYETSLLIVGQSSSSNDYFRLKDDDENDKKERLNSIASVHYKYVRFLFVVIFCLNFILMAGFLRLYLFNKFNLVFIQQFILKQWLYGKSQLHLRLPTYDISLSEHCLPTLPDT